MRKRGRAEQVLAMLKGRGGGGQKKFGVVFLWKLEISAILKGEAQIVRTQ